MNQILAIAGNTWRNVLKMKVVYFLICCTWILVACAINYDVLSLGLEKELLIDVSLLLTSVTAVLSVISITFDISKQLKNGEATHLLSKPLDRLSYLLGKLLGNIEVGFFFCIMVALGSIVILHLAFPGTVSMALIQSYILIMLSIIPMAALAILFSLLLPEVVAPIITAIIIWLTFSTGIVANIPLIYGGIIPDLELFNLKGVASYEMTVPWCYVIGAAFQGIFYAVAATALSSLVFNRKDIH